MDGLTIAFWGIGIVGMAAAAYKDKRATRKAAVKAKGMLKHMLVDIVGILFLIGLILTFLPPETIQRVLGENGGWAATVTASVIGSITLIPAFVAFPLIGSLRDAGAAVVPLTAFLTTLTMVGIVTFPVEKKSYGIKFTVMRNGLSFLAALGIAWAMGGVV